MSNEREQSLRALLTSQGFSRTAVQTLFRIGNWQELSPGDPFLVCGQRVGSLAVVEQGEIGVLSRHAGGRECFLISLAEGDIVGWEAFSSESTSMFTVRARRHTRLWRIPAAALDPLVAEAPQIAAHLAEAALATMRRIRTAGKALLLRSCNC